MNKNVLVSIIIMFFSFYISVAQDIKFIKQTTKSVELDIYANQKSGIEYTRNKFEITYSTSTHSGKCIVYNYETGEKWIMHLSSMYTGVTNGLKVYYFQSKDDKAKISCTREEPGLAIYNYTNKLLIQYY
jgi:hypothetical protein